MLHPLRSDLVAVRHPCGDDLHATEVAMCVNANLTYINNTKDNHRSLASCACWLSPCVIKFPQHYLYFVFLLFSCFCFIF
jgi:hypothetical protein